MAKGGKTMKRLRMERVKEQTNPTSREEKCCRKAGKCALGKMAERWGQESRNFYH